MNAAMNFRQWRKAYLNARTVPRLLLAWSILVAAILLWQSLKYRGLASAAAEWQFERFGHYFPLLTLLLLVASLGFPIFYLLFRRPRIRTRTRDGATDEATLVQAHATVFRNRLAWLSAGFAVAALFPLLLALGQPRAGDRFNPVSVANPAPPAEGATALTGSIRFDRASTLDGDMLLLRRQLRFAPVQPANGAPSRIRYFVELREGETQAAPGASRQGILERGGLPGEVATLYRDAGYDIAEPHYVLFASAVSMRWPFLALAAQLGLLALLTAIAATVQGWRLRKMRRQPETKAGLASA